jgi:hypothetical protein
MQRSPTNSAAPARTDEQPRGSLGGGFAAGLVPLGPVAAIVIVAAALAALARRVAAGQGFSAQQLAAGLVLVLGLLGAAASYALFGVRAVRRVRQWQQAGQAARANGALWGLVAVALVLLLPILLAIFVPQHPAPNLAP